jgi:hypothetical protein
VRSAFRHQFFSVTIFGFASAPFKSETILNKNKMKDPKYIFELDSKIKYQLYKINKITPLIDELIPIEKKLNELGVTIEINLNQAFINLSTKDEIDL